MADVGESHGSRRNETWHTQAWDMVHIKENTLAKKNQNSRTTLMVHGLRYSYMWVMVHIDINHDTHINVSHGAHRKYFWYTQEWVMAHCYTHKYNFKGEKSHTWSREIRSGHTSANSLQHTLQHTATHTAAHTTPDRALLARYRALLAGSGDPLARSRALLAHYSTLMAHYRAPFGTL